MAFRNGRFLIAGGNTGFDTQPQGQIQQFLNLVEFDMTAQEAVSRKRFITHAFPASHHPHAATNELYLERGFPPDAAEELRSRGHTIGRSGIIGNANVLYWNPERNKLEYGADHRGENSGFIISP
jgi:gamma-glutamyltranspeptidase/glutathione hydrolase